MFISYPHFYLSDADVQNNVEGLRPDEELHQSHMILEPVSLHFDFLTVRLSKPAIQDSTILFNICFFFN